MASPIIEVGGIAKRYTLGTIGATRLIDDVERLWHRATGRAAPAERGEFWALHDVSFQVQQGDVVGVIGRNGAGKSTLLKILSRITEPTRGEVVLRGRVASLLEVGTGFVGDLSGRDNIFLNGAILGMTKAEIRRKFDEIVNFAEVEQFIDTPVKRYSSGMYVRLAFAVAAHLEPEILIVDEVLAVGDAQFQKKCLGKMGDVSREGRTILFVSHNMTAVQSLCRRAVMLRSGRLVADDAVGTVVTQYLEEAQSGGADQVWDDPTTAPGDDLVRLHRIRIAPEGDRDDRLLTMQEPIRIETDYWLLNGRTQHHITYHLVNDQGITVLTTGTMPAVQPTGLYRAAFSIPGHLLNSGGYFLTLFVVENSTRPTYRKEGVASFVLVDGEAREHGYHGREPGVVQPVLTWRVEALRQ